jgi:hypothetical protein
MYNETGNQTENLIDHPSYWNSLVEYFGDKDGLGHHEFASSEHNGFTSGKNDIFAEEIQVESNNLQSPEASNDK